MKYPQKLHLNKQEYGSENHHYGAAAMTQFAADYLRESGAVFAYRQHPRKEIVDGSRKDAPEHYP